MFETLIVKSLCVCVCMCVCVCVCACVCVCFFLMVTAEGKVDAVTFGTGSGGTLSGKWSTKSLALPSISLECCLITWLKKGYDT